MNLHLLRSRLITESPSLPSDPRRQSQSAWVECLAPSVCMFMFILCVRHREVLSVVFQTTRKNCHSSDTVVSRSVQFEMLSVVFQTTRKNCHSSDTVVSRSVQFEMLSVAFQTTRKNCCSCDTVVSRSAQSEVRQLTDDEHADDNHQ